MFKIGDLDYYRIHMLTLWLELCEEHGLRWVETGPTFKSDGTFNGAKKTAVLDHFYARCAGNITVEVLPDAASDHAPVLATISKENLRNTTQGQYRTGRNWKNLNKDL